MRVLYIEDSEGDADLARWTFARRAPEIELVVATTLASGRRCLSDGSIYDAVLLDLNLPDGSGIGFLADLQDLERSLPVVVITGSGDQEVALSALRAGADDYVTKRDDYLDELPAALEGAIERHRQNSVRRGARLSVLYAEPNAFDADLTRRHFARHAPNVRLDTVLAAEDVLARLSSTEAGHGRYDAIVLDYCLPGRDGLELARVLRRQQHLDTPIVLLTGHGSGEVAAKAMRLGVDAYLPKREGYLFELAMMLEKLQQQTELVRERARLAETSRRFGYLLSASPTVLYNLRVDGHRLEPLWVSGNILRITGYPATDVMVREWWSGNLHPDDRAVTLGAQRQLFARETMIYEYRFRHRNGHYVWIRDEQRLLRDEQGNPTEVVGAWQIVDEQKKAELKLMESERRFRTLFEDMPAISVQGYDGERKVIYWNRASEVIYGYSAEEAMGRRLEELIVPEDSRDLVVARVQDWVESGKAVPVGELTLRRKDGAPVCVFSSHVMLRNVRDEPEMYSVDIDLNEQKRALDELARSEARYRQVVDNANEVIFQADRLGRWTFLNPAWEALTGYPVEASLGRQCVDFLHPDDHIHALTSIDKLVYGEVDSCRHEMRVVGRRGNIRWVEIFARLGGEEAGLFGTLSDVTERVSQRMLQHARADVLDRIVADEPLVDVIEAIARYVESMRPQVKVMVLLLDPDSGCLGSPVAPSLPDFFTLSFEGLLPGEGRGAGGEAAWTGRPVVIEDIRIHPNCQSNAELAERAGVRACWARPLRDEAGRVLGTFSVYHAEPHLPDDAEFSLVDEFANLTSVAVQRRRAGQAVRHREVALEMSANVVLEMLREQDFDAALAAVLSTAGTSTGVDRAYVYEVHEAPRVEAATTSLRHEWVRSGTEPPRTILPTENLCFEALGFDRWLATLRKGGIVSGNVGDFPERERELLESQGVVSILVVPIFLRDTFWGFIGFDTVGKRKLWSQSEENVLWILATSISAAVERKTALDNMRRAAAAFESTRDGVVITDLAGNIVTVNRAYLEITGFTEAEVVGSNTRIVKSGRQSKAFYEELWSCLLEHGYWQGEIWNRRKDGETCPQWLTISTVRDESGMPTHYVGVTTDISQLKRSEAELERLAHYDPLTDLPNRVLVRLRLDHAIEQARRQGQGIGVLFIDLDRFKNVNDSFGHPVGDELLVEIARRLKTRLRAEDTLARLGGDEFLLVMERLASPDEAGTVAQALIRTLDEPFVLSGGQEVYVGASVGISLFPEDGSNPTELIQHADAALYQAKADGRSTYRFFTVQLSRAAQGRVELETRLRRALEREEFVLHYQPQIDIASGRIVGCEALLRWCDPERGLILPAHFIAVAEETGLIVPLGEWALRAACTQARQWIDDGLPPITMTVNLSGRQLWQADLTERVASIIEESGIAPESLELELTESTIMGHEELAGERLRALKQLGLTLAIDDFGTGYSSLAYLKRFPIDVLKIDREFVRDIPDDSSDMEIAAAVVAMAHALKMKVVAEGVETSAQLEFLRGLSCDTYQGFLFSQPVTADAFASRLRQEEGLTT